MRSLKDWWKSLDRLQQIARLVVALMAIGTAFGIHWGIPKSAGHEPAHLFTTLDQTLRSPLPAKKETTLRGEYSAIPRGFKVYAIMASSSNRYYVARDRIYLGPDGTWQQPVRPWPGKWVLMICFADPRGARLMEEWIGKTKDDGTIDYDYSRGDLPEGVYPDSFFRVTSVGS